RSANLQLGFMGQLSELWSVTANAGYSRALNQSNFNQYAVVLTPTGLGIEAIPSKIESAQNGSVYAVNLTHQGSRLLLNASASRQLAPTGFAYLTRQDTYECKANYTLSERWSFGGDARAVQYRNPPAGGVAPAVNVSYLSMSANWGWTEHTTVTLSAMRIAETIQSSHYNVASNEATLSLSHQFNHISFQ
ncbi:MAG: hypothetical protein ACRETD_11895, partial [Steroidobacteraceae bacterium]